MSSKLYYFKRVRKAFSGLFFISLILASHSASAQNFEAAGGGGIIFHWESDQIFYWNNEFSYKSRNFENRLDILQINSGMSRLSGEILKIGYSAKFDFKNVHPEFTAGYIKQSEIDAMMGTKKLKIGAAEGFYFGASPGFDIHKFTIKPLVLFAKEKFRDGDFNFFYGKPDVPKFLHMGLSVDYDEKNNVGFSYTDFDLNITNNDDMPLFNSGGRVIGAGYRRSFYDDKKRKKFTGALGAHSVELSMNGSLTPENQRYFLFPFEFFNIDGRLDARIGHAIFDFEFQRNRLTHSLKAGAVNVFGGEINANFNYKYRKFLGTSEKNESIDTITLKNTGLGILAYSFETPGWAINEKIRIDFGLRKILACPWGIGKLISEISDDAGGGIFDKIDVGELIKTILLSGLSGNFKIRF